MAQLPHEAWLRLVATARSGPVEFPAACHRSVAFLAVNSLTHDDAARLIENHQPNGHWPEATAGADAAAARAIAQELDGFTLAVESVAIHLGLHPNLRPEEYVGFLRAQGLPDDEPVAPLMLWGGEKVGEMPGADGTLMDIWRKKAFARPGCDPRRSHFLRAHRP